LSLPARLGLRSCFHEGTSLSKATIVGYSSRSVAVPTASHDFARRFQGTRRFGHPEADLRLARSRSSRLPRWRCRLGGGSR
jgi:hypothetical protein